MSKGDYTPGKSVVFNFNTHKADGTPITLAGTPALSVYKNSTTESTSGITLTVDYDSRTGMHHVVIDTSSDGTFYAAGNDFDVVITTGTVDSVSVVGSVVGSFSLSNRSALRPATADRTLVVDAAGLADANVVKLGPSGSGEPQTARDIGAAIPAASPGASGGLLIAGSNAATTFASVTCTGKLLISDGMEINAATANRVGLKIAGNGDGPAVRLDAGGTASQAVYITGSLDGIVMATNGSGIVIQSDSSAIKLLSGAYGLEIQGDTADVLLGGSGTIDGVITGNSTLSAAQVNAEADTAIADAALATASALASLVTTVGVAGAGLTALATQASVDDLPTNAELEARTLAAASYATATALATVNTVVDSILADTGTDGVVVASFSTAAKAEIEAEAEDALQLAVPDSIPADGSLPSVQQAVYMILQALVEGGISGTTWTVKKPDGSTTLFTVTLDSSTTPTSKTRAS